jgi:Mn-containing catalase
MFYHIKQLQYDARVSHPDPRFASLLLEQFGGGNGELKAAMQYFTQAFGNRQPHPDKYDMLMDIATEEFSHLEIVGATITMLLGPTNGELKDVFDRSGLGKMLHGNQGKEELIHQAFLDPQFFVLSGGGPTVTNSQGVPWMGSYVNANGDLSVDLRSNIAAESRAKIVYEYLRQFTEDPHVQDTLTFLMTREITHFQVFTAALSTVEPNFPPGVFQGDPRFSHQYYNMSSGPAARGPWNQGQGPWPQGQHWDYIEDPVQQVFATRGETQVPIRGTNQTVEEAQKTARQLAKQRRQEVLNTIPKGENRWSSYPQRQGQSEENGPGRPRR